MSLQWFLSDNPPEVPGCGFVIALLRGAFHSSWFRVAAHRGAASQVTQFKEQGFLPAAMLNYLSLLGWNDGTDQDIYSVEELQKADAHQASRPGGCAVQ